jgi:GTPase involved in cell partitioning and DNA repair
MEGDGVQRGDVILEVDANLNTLYSFRHQSVYQADEGKKAEEAI